MAALGPTITAEDLSLAGITGDLNTVLLGLTWSEAKAKVAAALALANTNEAIKAGAIANYTINGRAVSVSFAQLNTALDVLTRALAIAARSPGLILMPAEFA